MTDDRTTIDTVEGDGTFERAWDTYWSGTRQNAAHKAGGPQEVALSRFWQALAAEHLRGTTSARVLDAACGHGAVTGWLLARASQIQAIGVDYSPSAIAGRRQRYAQAPGVAASTALLPFADQSFDLVCSQFGLEYAGIRAFAESARVLAPGGLLAAAVHLQDGGIDRECQRNAATVEAIVHTGVLTRARHAFQAGFALRAGSGSALALQRASEQMAPAVQALATVIRERGPQAADGLARQIYQDIAHMYRKLDSYAAADVFGWIDGMRRELSAYQGRMQSMTAAALNAAQVQALHGTLQHCGLSLQTHRTLDLGPEREPAAWILLWRRH